MLGDDVGTHDLHRSLVVLRASLLVDAKLAARVREGHAVGAIEERQRGSRHSTTLADPQAIEDLAPPTHVETLTAVLAAVPHRVPVDIQILAATPVVH